MSEDPKEKNQKQKEPRKKKTDDFKPPEAPENETPGNIEELIRQLKEKLAQKNEEISLIEKELDSLKKMSEESNKTSESFGRAFEKLKKDIGEIQGYYDKKGSMIDAVVDDEKKKEIEGKIEEVDKEIEEEKGKVGNLENDLKKAKKAYETAEGELKTAQEVYDSAKNLQKEVENILKKLDNIRKSIEKEEENSNYSVMYFFFDEEGKEAGLGSLIKKMNGVTEDLDCFSPDKKVGVEEAVEEFKKYIQDKWAELQKKVGALNLEKKKEAMETSNKLYEESQKTLEELQSVRRSNILEKLKEIKFKNLKEE